LPRHFLQALDERGLPARPADASYLRAETQQPDTTRDLAGYLQSPLAAPRVSNHDYLAFKVKTFSHGVLRQPACCRSVHQFDPFRNISVSIGPSTFLLPFRVVVGRRGQHGMSRVLRRVSTSTTPEAVQVARLMPE
jgi:hypothetical protein